MDHTLFSDEKAAKVRELACRYHQEAEAYDRTICTGPIKHGAVMPIGYKEHALVSKNATALLAKLCVEADAYGISRQELRKEISRIAQ